MISSSSALSYGGGPLDEAHREAVLLLRQALSVLDRVRAPEEIGARLTEVIGAVENLKR